MAPGASESPSIEVGDLLARIDRGDDLLILDVRNEEEFQSWRLEGRRAPETVHVPYFDFIEDGDGSVGKVPRGRDLVVLCAKGGSSEFVAGILREAGVPARNVTGGMVAYGELLEPVRVPAEASETFELWQLNRRGKGCLSYVVVANGEALVVDPARHVEWYESFVASRNARVSRVLDTHVHADHVSGGPALAKRAGVPYSVAAGAGFDLKQDVIPLGDGDVFQLGGDGGVEVRVIATPGHTPGSTSYLVGGRYLLTGDTLFVASIGRPDLGGHAAEWGADLFRTLSTKVAALPDGTVVLPGHSSSPAEMGPDGVVSGRLGELERSVPELAIASEAEFVSTVSAAVKTPPESYAHILAVNLGTELASAEKISEWELGKNQCAAATRPSAATAA